MSQEAALLGKLIEHNNWANRRLIEACASLSAEQLDARPLGEASWDIRKTLIHLVEAQRNYHLLLTQPPEDRENRPLAWGELAEWADSSGAALLDLALGRTEIDWSARLRSKDGYRIEPWIVLVQAVHHGSDHRGQIAATMAALGLEPPWMDAWGFGDAVGALEEIA